MQVFYGDLLQDPQLATQKIADFIFDGSKHDIQPSESRIAGAAAFIDPNLNNHGT